MDEAAFIAECERLGEAGLRANLANKAYNERKEAWALNWLDGLDRARKEVADTEKLTLARLVAGSTRDQADAADKANLLAMWALVISVTSLMLAAYALLEG